MVYLSRQIDRPNVMCTPIGMLTDYLDRCIYYPFFICPPADVDAENSYTSKQTPSATRVSPKLLDRVRERIRRKGYSKRTEVSYANCIKRFILFHGKRHPKDLGAAEVESFLTNLAVELNVAAATQNQALSAILFLYRKVLELPLPWLDGIVRASLRACQRC